MMKFRVALVVFILSFCFHVVIAQAQQQDPQELSEARNNYTAEKEKAVKPVNARYLPKLEELKKQLTLRGDLKGALKVEQEIERIAASQTLSTQGDEPQELAEIKKTYSAEVQTALKPIHSLYLAKLEVLKQQLAQAGNLKGALAVEQEMEKVSNIVSGERKRAETKKLTVPAADLWFDTGIMLNEGENLSIKASGQWSNGGDSPKLVGPDGFNTTFRGTLLESANLASLVGKIGTHTFPIGKNYSGASPFSGKLFLSINDSANSFSDNTGSLEVLVSHGPK